MSALGNSPAVLENEKRLASEDSGSLASDAIR
jgi:hypothetical protein